MSEIARIKRAPRLRVVNEGDSERVFGSREFIARTRNPALQSPAKFEPTEKKDGDVVL